MKAGVRSAFFTIAITLILTTTAFAQAARLSVDIPFDFNVGNVQMSSGKYTVKALSATTLQIKSAESDRSVVSISNIAATPQDLKTSQLVFIQYGNRYFLSAVDWLKGSSRELPRTKSEIQAARIAGTRR
jgi:hypothetical protein